MEKVQIFFCKKFLFFLNFFRLTTLASLYSKTNEDASSSLFDILHLRFPDIIGGNSGL